MDKTVLNIIGVTLAIAAWIVFFSLLVMDNPLGGPWSPVIGVVMLGSGLAVLAGAGHKWK